jgi:hypothetical protein
VSDDPGKTPETDAPEAKDEGKTPPAGTVDDPGGRDESSSLSPEDARKLRSEAKNLRDRLKALETEKKERDEADLSATQKLEREKSALEAEKQQLAARVRDAEVKAIAARVGVKADLADTVTALIDWDDVDADDPKAIEKAVKELVKERPSLSGKTGLDGGRRGGNGSGETDMDSIIRRAAGRA